MVLTYFLAELIGFYMIIVGLSMLFSRNRWMHVISEFYKDENQALAYMVGIIVLPFGLMLVLVHNVWNAGTPALIVTLFGWIVLVKSVFLFAVSPSQFKRFGQSAKMRSWWYVYAIIVLLIGAYLVNAGFSF